MVKFKHTHIVFLTGPSGSGKDTLLNRIKEELGHQIYMINNGDLVRSFAKANDPMSLALRRHNQTGKLTPVMIFYGLILKKLDVGLAQEWPIFWNGSPRQMEEMKHIDEVLNMVGMKGLILHIDASDSVCRSRMLTRQSELKKAGKAPRPEDIEGKIKAWNTPSSGRGTMARIANDNGRNHSFEYHRISTDEKTPDEVFERAMELLQDRGLFVPAKRL